MALVPGERATEIVRARVDPSVRRRWQDALNGAKLRREASDANELLDRLLERYESDHRVGRSNFPVR